MFHHGASRTNCSSGQAPSGHRSLRPLGPERIVGHSENGRDGGLARAIRHSCREVQIPFAQATGHELHVRALCLDRGAEFENSVRPVQVGHGPIRVLRLCSVRSVDGAQIETGYSVSPERDAGKLCMRLQNVVSFR